MAHTLDQFLGAHDGLCVHAPRVPARDLRVAIRAKQFSFDTQPSGSSRPGGLVRRASRRHFLGRDDLVRDPYLIEQSRCGNPVVRP
jgi:hypothetical protein